MTFDTYISYKCERLASTAAQPLKEMVPNIIEKMDFYGLIQRVILPNGANEATEVVRFT